MTSAASIYNDGRAEELHLSMNIAASSPPSSSSLARWSSTACTTSANRTRYQATDGQVSHGSRIAQDGEIRRRRVEEPEGHHHQA